MHKGPRGEEMSSICRPQGKSSSPLPVTLVAAESRHPQRLKSHDQDAHENAGSTHITGVHNEQNSSAETALAPLIFEADPVESADTSRLATIAKLLGDESVLVKDELRRQFHAAGKRGRPLLNRAKRSEDPRTRGHARTLLLELDRAEVRRRLISFASRTEIDLEAGLLLLARLQDPSLDARPYLRTLDAFADEVIRLSADCGTELERGKILTDYLSQTVGFNGTDADYHHPDNVHLHRVIETRSGLPLSLCAVHLLVARRVGLRASILPLPGHVMLRIHGLRRSRIIDCFHGGRARSQGALMAYLSSHKLGFEPNWFRAASDKNLFLRQVNNLVQTYSERGFPSEIETLLDVLEAADRSS